MLDVSGVSPHRDTDRLPGQLLVDPLLVRRIGQIARRRDARLNALLDLLRRYAGAARQSLVPPTSRRMQIEDSRMPMSPSTVRLAYGSLTPMRRAPG